MKNTPISTLGQVHRRAIRLARAHSLRRETMAALVYELARSLAAAEEVERCRLVHAGSPCRCYQMPENLWGPVMKALTLAAVLARLEYVRPQGSRGFTARCPSHDDRSPSLSVSQGAEGKVLLCCHAGCELSAIVYALGLETCDLFPEREAPAWRAQGRDPAKPPPPEPSKVQIKPLGPVTEAQIRALSNYGYNFAAPLYREAAAFCVSLKNLGTGKTRSALGFLGFTGFSARWKIWEVRAQGELWKNNETGKLWRRNYGPADLIVSRSLWNFSPVERLAVVEGESDLLAYLKLGRGGVITTTCGAGNTTAFERPDAARWLRYKKPEQIYVYGDNDQAGRAGALKRAETLRWILPQARIFMPRLPEQFGDFRDLVGGENEDALGNN